MNEDHIKELEELLAESDKTLTKTNAFAKKVSDENTKIKERLRDAKASAKAKMKDFSYTALWEIDSQDAIDKLNIDYLTEEEILSNSKSTKPRTKKKQLDDKMDRKRSHIVGVVCLIFGKTLNNKDEEFYRLKMECVNAVVDLLILYKGKIDEYFFRKAGLSDPGLQYVTDLMKAELPKETLPAIEDQTVIWTPAN